jgi:hypothetical protein
VFLFIDLLIALGVVIAIGIPLWAIIDAARRSDTSFHQIGSDKTRWIVVLVVLSLFLNLVGVVVSVVYLTTTRQRLQKAGSSPPLQVSLPLSGPGSEQGSEVLASDQDRDRVTLELRHHFEAGRLTLDELTNRLDAALRARTVGELRTVTQDLPRV